MNKSDLINRMAIEANISTVAASRALDAALGTIKISMRKGDTVTLTGFGSFTPVKRAARIGRNPRTGEEIKIKGTTAPKFKAHKDLKDALNCYQSGGQ